MERLIQTSEYHPLTLVTYASVMRQGTDIYNPREWQEALENLITFLDGEESADDETLISNRGDAFPRTLIPSMTIMLKQLSTNALNLLILALVWDDSYVFGVPEVLLKMFCKHLEISPAAYLRLRNDLRNRCLIQLDRRYYGIQHHRIRCYSIHRLRKEIILEKQKGKVRSVISLLGGGASNSGDNEGDAIFEGAVCVVYGGSELRAATAPRLQHMLQARAVPAPRNSVNYSIDPRELAAWAAHLRLSIDPLLSLLDLDHLPDAHVLIKQVIANRVCRGEFGDELLSDLLRLSHWETTEAVSEIVECLSEESFYVSYRYQAVLQAVSAHFGRTLGTLLEVLKDRRLSSDGDRQELILSVLFQNFHLQLKGFNASVASSLAFTMRSPSSRLSCLKILKRTLDRNGVRAALFLGEQDVILESLETCLNDYSAASECFTISLRIIRDFSAVKGIGNKLAGFPGIIRHLEQHMEQLSLRTTERPWSDNDRVSVRALGNLSYDPRIRMMVADNLAIIVPSLICFLCGLNKGIVPFDNPCNNDWSYYIEILALIDLLANIALELELTEGSVQRLAKYPGLKQCLMGIHQTAPPYHVVEYLQRYIGVAFGRAFTILYPGTAHSWSRSSRAFWMGCALMHFDRNLLECALAAMEAALGLNTPAFDYTGKYTYGGDRWNDFYLKKILIQRCIYQVKTKMGDFCGALEDVELMLKSLYQMGTPERLLLIDFPTEAHLAIIPARLAYMKLNIDRAVLRILLRDLPGASSDFDFCICSLNSILDPELLRRLDDVLEEEEYAYLETMLYECLKFRGYVKYLLQDEEAARQDAESAIAIRNSSFHPLHVSNSRYYAFEIEEDLYFRPSYEESTSFRSTFLPCYYTNIQSYETGFFRACYQEPITYLEYHF